MRRRQNVCVNTEKRWARPVSVCNVFTRTEVQVHVLVIVIGWWHVRCSACLIGRGRNVCGAGELLVMGHFHSTTAAEFRSNSMLFTVLLEMCPDGDQY